MNRRLSIPVVVCLGALFVGSVVFALVRRTPSAQATTPPASSPAGRPTSSFFPTEQLWIVKEIAGALGNMAAYANGRPPSAIVIDVRQIPRTDSELARFEAVPASSTAVGIRITDHIWAPASYAPLATALAGKGIPCESSDAPLASALLQPTREIIQRENARVSARLRANMRCADAHAEAALLVGTLALREAATVFSDPRRLISRMTAHLALADALGVAADNETRRLSETVLYTLVGRQRTALDRLSELDSTGSSAVLHAWGRALRLRNTGDWRLVSNPNRASLLEQIELVRAAQYSLGDPRTLDFIDAIHNRAETADWARIVMQESHGVEASHRFAAEAIAMELTEAINARKTYAGTVPDSAEALVSALKVEPSQGPVASDGSVWVIDWSMWAAVAERHLMSTINARDTDLTYTLGVPDEARTFREQVAQTFSGLRLYPFLAIHLAPTKQDARPGMSGSLSLLQTHPELVSHWMWKTVLMKETWAGLPTRIPRLESMFTPPFPAGTVFEPNTRPWDAARAPQINAADIPKLRQAAPYSRSLPYLSIGPKYEEASAAVLQKEFGEMAEFNLSFAVRIANALKDDPDEYLAAMRRVVAMSPEHLRDVAEYHVEHDRLDDARQTFERWFATSRQEVAVANNAEWMVRDYFMRGQLAKANELADRAAHTYSPSGLLTRARLYDWTGNFKSAEEYYRREHERYDDPAALVGFLLRQHREGIDVDALKWKVFPGGVVSVAVPMLRDAPLSGVEVVAVEKIGEKRGIHPNDIVVAVDGVRVNNLAQYYAAKTMAVSPTMRLTVWRELRYTEVSGPPRYGGLWGTVKTYEPGAKKPEPAEPRRW